jgi:hypothetical protein
MHLQNLNRTPLFKINMIKSNEITNSIYTSISQFTNTYICLYHILHFFLNLESLISRLIASYIDNNLLHEHTNIYKKFKTKVREIFRGIDDGISKQTNTRIGLL